MRSEILKRLKCLGITENEEENEKIASFKSVHEGIISGDDSKVKVIVLPTDEEVMIALDTYELVI